jgi:hypothetical protein
MDDPFNWTCPFCNRDTVIQDHSVHDFQTGLLIDNYSGPLILRGRFIVCPNRQCRQYTLALELHSGQIIRGQGLALSYPPVRLKRWALVPESAAKGFPGYVPKQILQDYGEACRIVNLSPKAAATLARRCLQGMIRDFWKIRKRNLKLEIDALRGRLDPMLWKAVDAVRSIGNIGAHMEKSVDVIIEVDPDEADQLLRLIELLIREWYIRRHERELAVNSVVKTAELKKQAKAAQTPKGVN